MGRRQEQIHELRRILREDAPLKVDLAQVAIWHQRKAAEHARLAREAYAQMRKEEEATV